MDFSRLILVSVPERFSVLEVKERDKNRDSKLVVYKLRGDRAGRYSHDGGVSRA